MRNRADSASSNDCIVAAATAAGRAAIAVVRVDGAACWDVVGRVWCAQSQSGDTIPMQIAESGHVPQLLPPSARRLTLGTIRDASGVAIDEALLAWFPAPRSYTGNDLAELQCHGSPAVVAATVDALVAAGARMARPGEFTQRAFLNGRMDLAQAEAVANLIAAETDRAGRIALSQLEGAVSREVTRARERLIETAVEIEARIDFPEEEIEPAVRERLREAMTETREALVRLADSARRGRLYRDGARVVLWGRPNTGKSSLLNALVGIERALVTPHPGTTRDTIEATLDIAGVPVTLVDTAGVRDVAEAGASPADEIERLGIDRARREIERADLAVLVLDGSVAPCDEDARLAEALGDMPRLVAANKSDLDVACDDAELARRLGSGLRGEPILRISALRRDTLRALEEQLAERLGAGAPESAETTVVTNQRHEERLRAAAGAVDRALGPFDAGDSGELVMIDLHEAMAALGDILGLEIGDAILDRIFSKFCIGK